MTTKNDRYTIRMNTATRAALEMAADKAGYKSLAAFMLDAAADKAELVRDEDILVGLEERIAATFTRVMQMIQTVNDGVQVNVSQVSKLAEAFFACVPPPPPEAIEAAVAQARLRYARWERNVTNDLTPG